MKPLIRNLLRMSAYQILFMDGVPDSAACNEAVKLAAKRKFQSLKGFVNGILRSIVREKDVILSGGGEKAFYPDRRKLLLLICPFFIPCRNVWRRCGWKNMGWSGRRRCSRPCWRCGLLS